MGLTRYFGALATVLRGSAVPYGYTVTVWTSGMMLTRERGMPSTGEVFLFMAGAVLGFCALGVIVRLVRASPFEPAYDAVRRTGMLHLIAVGGALGAVTLIARVHSGFVWPLGAFVATAAYLGLASVELVVAGGAGEGR